MYDHGEIGRALRCCHAQAAHIFRQSRQGLRHTVLHLNLRLVHIAAELESDVQIHHAIGGGLRRHVEHILDAVDGFFERCCDGFGDDFGIRSRKYRAHIDIRRHYFRVFANRQTPQCNRAADKNNDG